MLNAGRLNRRVTITSRSSTQDAAGPQVETWADVTTVWGDIKAPAGAAAAERLGADRETSTAAYSIRIRYRTDITDAMRVEYGTIVYKIQAVLPDQSGHKHLDLVCEEVR